MSSIGLLQLESLTQECDDSWSLTLAISEKLLGSSEDPLPAVDISESEVRLESTTSGITGTFAVPAKCGRINSETAQCKLSRRKARLTVTWQGASSGNTTSESANTSKTATATNNASSASSKTSCDQSTSKAGSTNEPTGILHITNTVTPAAAGSGPYPSAGAGTAGQSQKKEAAKPEAKTSKKNSIDYSRFDNIGDDDEEEKPRRSAPPVEVPPSAKVSIDEVSKKSASASNSNSLDYSRFEDVNEEDAGLSNSELQKAWQRHKKLRRMRGEEPLDFEDWQKGRARMREIMDPAGRGLWARTNMDDTFDEEASTIDKPPDEELPSFPGYEYFSALRSAPESKTLDATAWAKQALRDELVKACATDRQLQLASLPKGESRRPEDFRTDVIVHTVDVNEGNACLVSHEDHYLCAYRFKVNISYSVNLLERPLPGDETGGHLQFQGDVSIPDLVSGGPPGSVTEAMRTSLRAPKPGKLHMALIRPLLMRLELSIAHFVRRFERRFLLKPTGESK
eukprot:TRINITY_DN16080_c0_g1_i1.p1 TRINITY_DN16080_c0_g1~~TRINITY_DN16080_c0_g1_i1.p1  ORF type:complete len:523 (-),score=97.89 TRINITY_DN16080_c0_g1_i1:121-1656(-)